VSAKRREAFEGPPNESGPVIKRGSARTGAPPAGLANRSDEQSTRPVGQDRYQYRPDLVSWSPLTSGELARYVTTQPEIARRRRTLIEVYRLLTDYATSACVVRQIAPEIDGLDAWLQNGRPHL
jgi:hypothetical protein